MHTFFFEPARHLSRQLCAGYLPAMHNNLIDVTIVTASCFKTGTNPFYVRKIHIF
jgi:hypothetical protein